MKNLDHIILQAAETRAIPQVAIQQFTAADIRACANGLRDGMGGHADYCAEIMEHLANNIAAAEQAKTVTLEQLVANLKAGEGGDAIGAAMDRASADMELGRRVREQAQQSFWAQPRCACGDSFTSDAVCANCLAAQPPAQQQADESPLLRQARQLVQDIEAKQQAEPGPIIARYGYQPLFNAISSAVQWRDGRTIEISVLDFQKALLAAVKKDPRQAFEEFHLGKPFAVAPTCQTCNGHGMVSRTWDGRMVRHNDDGHHAAEPCPDCAAQKGGQ